MPGIVTFCQRVLPNFVTFMQDGQQFKIRQTSRTIVFSPYFRHFTRDLQSNISLDITGTGIAFESRVDLSLAARIASPNP
jgi:hypothetical protein